MNAERMRAFDNRNYVIAHRGAFGWRICGSGEIGGEI
jgi:hypothetical protein